MNEWMFTKYQRCSPTRTQRHVFYVIAWSFSAFTVSTRLTFWRPVYVISLARVWRNKPNQGVYSINREYAITGYWIRMLGMSSYCRGSGDVVTDIYSTWYVQQEVKFTHRRHLDHMTRLTMSGVGHTECCLPNTLDLSLELRGRFGSESGFM